MPEKSKQPSRIDIFFQNLGISQEDLKNGDFLELEKRLGIDSNRFGNTSKYSPLKIITYAESLRTQYDWAQKINTSVTS